MGANAYENMYARKGNEKRNETERRRDKTKGPGRRIYYTQSKPEEEHLAYRDEMIVRMRRKARCTNAFEVAAHTKHFTIKIVWVLKPTPHIKLKRDRNSFFPLGPQRERREVRRKEGRERQRHWQKKRAEVHHAINTWKRAGRGGGEVEKEGLRERRRDNFMKKGGDLSRGSIEGSSTQKAKPSPPKLPLDSTLILNSTSKSSDSMGYSFQNQPLLARVHIK